MADKYSELEVVPNESREPIPEAIDNSAHAPERDLSGEAPELNKKSWPLQVSCYAQLALQTPTSSDKLGSRTLLPTHLDPTSRIEKAMMPHNSAPQIQITVQERTTRH